MLVAALRKWLLGIMAICCWMVVLTNAEFKASDDNSATERVADTLITNLNVSLLANPTLIAQVEFVYKNQRYVFGNLKLVRPLLESGEPSTTFRTLAKHVEDVPTWASVTLLKGNLLAGIFVIQNGKNTLRIDSSYTKGSGRTLEGGTYKAESVNIMRTCGSVTSAELEIGDEHATALSRNERITLETRRKEGETRPPPDPLGKGLNHHARDLSGNREDRDLQVFKWADGASGCFPRDDIRRRLYIGIATDRAMEQRLKLDGYTSVEKYVETLMSSVNAVYLAQMNVEIVVSQILQSTRATLSAELAVTSPKRVTTQCQTDYDPITDEITGTNCCDDKLNLLQRLEVLRTWIDTLNVSSSNPNSLLRQGHWHLLTDCHPAPGFVGRSYIGTLCHATHFAGVSSYGPPANPSLAHWRILAHEIGHAFNSSHSFEYGIGQTGGIMDYGDGKYDGDYQFHPFKKAEVCSEIASQADMCRYLEAAETVCGDGVLEMQKGEECECPNGATNCTDCMNCKLMAPAQCVRGTMCCDGHGRFLPSNTTCMIDNGRTGICIQGTCQVNVCPVTSTVCAAEECRVRCAPLNSNTSCSVSYMFLPDAMPCNGGRGVCLTGACVDSSAINTQAPTTADPSSCVDFPSPWWDADSTMFTCKWYSAHPSMCGLYGFRLRNFGYTAVEACCGCGGGLRPGRSKSPTVTPTSSAVKPTASPTTAITPSPTSVCDSFVDQLDLCSRKKSQTACTKRAGCAWCRPKNATMDALQRKSKNKKKKTPPPPPSCVPGPCSLARDCGFI